MTKINNGIKDNNLFVKGIVVDINDPKSESRVKVRIPCYHGSTEDENSVDDSKLPWAQTCLQGNNLFNIGDIVWITFEGGDTRYPVIFGQLGSTSLSTKDMANNSFGGIVGGEYVITIDGTDYNVKGSTLAEMGVSIITINEGGSEDAYNGHDVNGPSAGLMGFHASTLFDVLRRIRNKNSTIFDSLAKQNNASQLIADVQAGNSSFLGGSSTNNVTIPSTSSTGKAIIAILTSDIGKEIQLEVAAELVQNYINLGLNSGVSDNGALLFLADISNQGPYMNICTSMRKASDKSLDNFFNMSVNVKIAGYDMTNRRTLTYKIIKELQNLGALNGTNGVLETPEGWKWPVPSCKAVSSPYGNRDNPFDTNSNEFHKGIDIPGMSGAIIVAANSGIVATAELNGRAFNDSGAYVCGGIGYGNCTVINHENGYYTLYAHQSSFSVVKGQKVLAGQTIGAVGSTGNSTGPHLHFEVRKSDGTHYDPQKFVSMNDNPIIKVNSSGSKSNKTQLSGNFTATYYGNYPTGDNTKGGSGRILKTNYSCAIPTNGALSIFGCSSFSELYNKEKEIYIECDTCPSINGTYRIDDAGADKSGSTNIDLYYTAYSDVPSDFKKLGVAEIKIYV